jgi:putative Mg2+ transporter-C (MgtC) family protein
MPHTLDSLDALSPQFWIPVGVSVVCGAIIGFERQLRGKPLDVRTAVLICLGTNVYIRLGVVISGEHADTMRILGQVVTGIGFLGAGVIFNRGAHVQGLTTAAVVWTLAAIGAAIGFERYSAAIAFSIVVFLVLNVLEWIENRVEHMRRGAHAHEDREPRL